MQLRIEDVSPVEKKLIVEVPWTAVGARIVLTEARPREAFSA